MAENLHNDIIEEDFMENENKPLDQKIVERISHDDNTVGTSDIALDWQKIERLKRMMVELQSNWLKEYSNSREKALVELTEKLHQEFLADQQKIRAELLQQFKEEEEQARADEEAKYREQLKAECAKLTEKHKRELASSKKKQWCWQCDNEAIYHCCWNTSYCSVECQQGHWQAHRKLCRRKKANQSAPGAGAGAAL